MLGSGLPKSPLKSFALFWRKRDDWHEIWILRSLHKPLTPVLVTPETPAEARLWEVENQPSPQSCGYLSVLASVPSAPSAIEDSRSRAQSDFTPLHRNHQKRTIVQSLNCASVDNSSALDGFLPCFRMRSVHVSKKDSPRLRARKLCLHFGGFVYSCTGYSGVWMCANERSARRHMLIFCYIQTWAAFKGGFFCKVKCLEVPKCQR